MIEIQNLTKRYDMTTVVDDVSFSVEKGQIAALVGTSGSGKTTLLRMINRLVEPTSGTVLIGGGYRDDRPASAAAPDRICHSGPRPVSASDGGAEYRHRAAIAGLERGGDIVPRR